MAAVSIDVFLGLVTHPTTRFPQSSGDDGLARALAVELAQRGLFSEVVVSSDNAWSPALLPIDAATVGRSIDAELEVEAQWRLWHSPKTPAWAMNLFMTARRLYRHRKYLPNKAIMSESHPGFTMVRRLANIELAHMALLRAARDSGAKWALVLEDDAVGSPRDTAEMLISVFTLAQNQSQPLYVNVSRSFSDKHLRIDSHMQLVENPYEYADDGPRLYTTDKPVTNTVCAVLYRNLFLESLVKAMDEIPMDPVIPIDWKLNAALMNLWNKGLIASGDCWIAQPAPIIQASMHAQ